MSRGIVIATLLWTVACVSRGTLGAGSCREARLCCAGRDSSCVVQKTPPNAIVEDLSDKPCYCDHACLKLADCCEDFKTACGVVDCEVSPWEHWGDCSATCGAGSMRRTRSIVRAPANGGRRCPPLVQTRGCQDTKGCGDTLHHRLPQREIAMLLPSSLSISRRVNETNDIRRNLRTRYPPEPEHDTDREYCVEFEVLKASKACKREPQFSGMREGNRVCVRCEIQAFRKNLGWRCEGHGVVGRSTRWSALPAPHCHGKWLRLEDNSDIVTTTEGENEADVDRLSTKPIDNKSHCSSKTCSADEGASFIFV